VHVIGRLYQSEFDFPTFPSQRRTEYMLATVPRSGSTHLAVELWRTGVLGAPMEYANPPYIAMLRSRLAGDTDIVRYWNDVRDLRTSPNGIFGYKMFIANYLQCEELHPALLREIAPDKVIFLTRRDVLQQSISLLRATQTKAWFHGIENLKEPEYSYGDIKSGVLQIQQDVETWQKIFALGGASVYPVLYEDLQVDEAKVVAGICAYLGVAYDPSSFLDIPRMSVQRTRESMDWKQRFLDEASKDPDALIAGDTVSFAWH